MARMFKIEKKTWWNQNFSTSRMYFWANFGVENW